MTENILTENLRLYHRFPILNPRICFLSTNGTPIGAVSEISYGGLSVTLSEEKLAKRKRNLKLSTNKEPQLFQLTFLNKSIYCHADERYQNENKVGFQLAHEQTEVLLFLKEIVPWIRAGAALGCLNKLERDGFTKELPEHLNFDGPIPVEIDWKGVDENKIPNFAITFKQDKVLFRITKTNQSLLTEHNVWPGAESGELRPTLSLDDTICRNGLSILLGLAIESEDEIFNLTINSVLDIYEHSKNSSIWMPSKQAY